MLLVIDVGNTNTVLGVYDGKDLVHDWRIRTVVDHTVDEYGMLVYNLYKNSRLSSRAIRDIIISSWPSHCTSVAGSERSSDHPLIVGPGSRRMPIL